MLAKLMFPTRPSTCSVPNGFLYPPQLRTLARISAEQIRRHINGLSPHKAPGPDGIPNSVLKFCTDIITPRLIPIYRAILRLKVYPTQWRESTTCVLRRPGKPRYDVPKAYRPIALLNTLAKLLSSIVAEGLSFLTEAHRSHHHGLPSFAG